MVDTLEAYKTLEVEPGASADRIRRSYIELTRVWDPERYIDNPAIRNRAVKKRQEIDDAYLALRSFLPDLQNVSGESKDAHRPVRDFKEMSSQTVLDHTRAIMGVLVAIVLLLLFAWAFYLLMKGRTVTSASVPLE